MFKKICEICERGCTDAAKIKECTANPMINIGSGGMIKPEYINFDVDKWERPQGNTDIIGDIRDLTKIFPPRFFHQILCCHVIEHFRRADAEAVLRDFILLLRPNGRLIIEAPDVVGAFNHYIVREKDEKGLAGTLFGESDRGPHWCHRSGWTRDSMAEELTRQGMRIVHTGIGMTHGMGPRDLRVEGLKNR